MAVPDLLKIAKSVFTTSTKSLGPTAPLESDGALLTVKEPDGPVKPFPTPRKFRIVAGARLIGCWL
jgi:hypothetical protein